MSNFTKVWRGMRLFDIVVACLLLQCALSGKTAFTSRLHTLRLPCTVSGKQSVLYPIMRIVALRSKNAFLCR